MAIAAGCTSAAWCATIYSVAGRMAAYLPTRAQCEIWAKGPDTRVSASFRSTGEVQAIEKGWRLSGEWHYLSGINHAQWALLCIDPKEKGQESRFAAVPFDSWRVLDDWRTLGMRGTGSRSIILDRVDVPEYMTFARSDLGTRCSQYAEGPQYSVSPIGSDPQLFISCAFGAVLSAFKQWDKGLKINDDIPDYVATAYSDVVTVLDVCWMLLERSCSLSDLGKLSRLQTASHAREGAFAAKELIKSINEIFRLGGTNGQSDTNFIQKYWRDLHTLTAHVGLRREPNFMNYANLALKKDKIAGN